MPRAGPYTHPQVTRDKPRAWIFHYIYSNTTTVGVVIVIISWVGNFSRQHYNHNKNRGMHHSLSTKAWAYWLICAIAIVSVVTCSTGTVEAMNVVNGLTKMECSYSWIVIIPIMKLRRMVNCVHKEMLSCRFLGSDLMCNHLLWDTLMQVVSGGRAHYWNNWPL